MKGTDLYSGCNTIEFRIADLTEYSLIVVALHGRGFCPNALPVSNLANSPEMLLSGATARFREADSSTNSRAQSQRHLAFRCGRVYIMS